jgi:hypothetical protein
MERLKEIPIEGADFQYFASTLGKIYRWNGKNFRELNGWNHYYRKWDHHYRRYGIKINGKYKNMYGQRLVLLAFDGPPPNPSSIARHGPNGSLDNRPCQLKWGTHQENMCNDRQRDGNYYNRGRKKKIKWELEKWNHDPLYESLWDQIERDNKNGIVHSCPF